MIFTAEDNVKFKKATHCHICDEALPLGSTKIDHLANIGKWLRIMGLKKCMPKYKEVEKKRIISNTLQMMISIQQKQNY